MVMEPGSVHLDQILIAAYHARSFIADISRQAFLSDVLRQYAVTMAIVVIGEAATRLIMDVPEIVMRHPEVPWHRIRNMRNRVAHGYFGTDFDRVWNTVTESMPRLVDQIVAIRGSKSANA